MKISIVTISYNQKRFLERAILSVLNQDYKDIEYIVVDAGSTDGSIDIINSYKNKISNIIIEPDNGPADGLNKGFSLATGEIYAFLNADDILLESAVSRAMEILEANHSIDVLYGNSLVIDENDKILRRSYSDSFSLFRRAYRGCVIMQPSTFFRSCKYIEAGGFNVDNKSNWDGELFNDMALCGAVFYKVKHMLSGYRLHSESITSSQRLHFLLEEHYKKMFSKIMGRQENKLDILMVYFMRILKHFLNLAGLKERIMHGRIYGRR